MTARRRKFWGWGFEDQQPSNQDVEQAGQGAREQCGRSEGAWREAFLQAPYLRDTLVAAGVLAETFETAVPWDRFDAFVNQVREATEGTLGGEGRVTCRLTHVYPDGAALYFTVLAPARRGGAPSASDSTASGARLPTALGRRSTSCRRCSTRSCRG